MIHLLVLGRDRCNILPMVSQPCALKYYLKDMGIGYYYLCYSFYPGLHYQLHPLPIVSASYSVLPSPHPVDAILAAVLARAVALVSVSARLWWP
jgi:hypothetical protein